MRSALIFGVLVIMAAAPEQTEVVGLSARLPVAHADKEIGVEVDNVNVPAVPVTGKPSGPIVPFKVECYQHNFTPFIVTDKDGNTLFEIKCP
jgi:hypothetical protein